MQNVPINIRQHLIPFFFKQSKEEQVVYGNKKMKGVLYSTTVSSVGRIMRMLMVKSGQLEKVDNFNLFITVNDAPAKNKYSGEFYKQVNGTNSFLKLPPEANEDINDLLEDIFRMHFYSYIDGCIDNNGEAFIRKAIDRFIDKYDLLEFGYSNDTLRRLYYNEKKKGKILGRFQVKSPLNTMNCAYKIVSH